MATPKFDQDSWEQLRSKTLREHADKLTRCPPNAQAAGTDVAERINWIEGDLATWTAEPGHYDLVVCVYVHVAGSVEDMVGRLANGVAPRGTLFLVGHRPIDPSTGTATAAASQVQVSAEDAVAALDFNVWELVVGEYPHPARHGMFARAWMPSPN